MFSRISSEKLTKARLARRVICALAVFSIISFATAPVEAGQCVGGERNGAACAVNGQCWSCTNTGNPGTACTVNSQCSGACSDGAPCGNSGDCGRCSNAAAKDEKCLNHGECGRCTGNAAIKCTTNTTCIQNNAGSCAGQTGNCVPHTCVKTCNTAAVCNPNIPTLSQWGIIGMAFLMLGGVLFMRRRRQSA